ncbi:MAG TPA: hypothetical protein PLQ93_06640 [Bacteroidia bacterium]|nr:hypothetical protein [Bacteroidia bacterium]
MLIPLPASSQEAKPISKDLTEKVYNTALADFIRAANKKNTHVFDTLYIADRKLGQSDDFPEIRLEDRIENTTIILISPEGAKITQQERKTRVYINLVGWVDSRQAEFMFVVFSGGFAHQYDYHLKYACKEEQKGFVLSSIEYKGQPFDK